MRDFRDNPTQAETGKCSYNIPCGRGLLAKTARMAVLLLTIAVPIPSSASLPPRNMDFANKPDKDMPMSDDIRQKCIESSIQIDEITSEKGMYALARLTKAISSKSAIDEKLASDFIRLAEKYGADAGLIRSILNKKTRTKADNKALITQAEIINMAFLGIIKNHLENLESLYKATKDEGMVTKIDATKNMLVQLAGNVVYLQGLMQ